LCRRSIFCTDDARTFILNKYRDRIFVEKKPSILLDAFDRHALYVDFITLDDKKVYICFLKLKHSIFAHDKLNSFLNSSIKHKFTEVKPEIERSKFWIQLHGVEKNDKGWLFGGISD